MRVKTAYREIQPDNSAENIPKELPVSVVSAPPAAPAVAVAVEPPVTAVEVDASLALQQQLQKLQESEQLQRQRAPQQLPQTREQKLHLWKQQGLTDAEARFLEQHPKMIDHPEIASAASVEAMQAGHARDSASYWKATEMNFNNHLDRRRVQATAKPATQPTPEFFQPPPPPKPPTRSNIVSAPVSRSLPGSNIERDLNPKQMTLTAEEMQIAQASGISAVDYARGKLRLQREKAAGERQ